MSNNLFVGGFPYETTQEGLSALFRTCGTVVSAKILVERETGRSRGLGFVEMSTEAEARAAIAKLNGSTLGARKIFVSEARPQEGRPGGLVVKPGFVERRSGKDRRQARGTPGGGDVRRERPIPEEGRREGFFERKKKWAGKPSFSGKKEWTKRPDFNKDPKKPWSGKPASPGKKEWEKRPAFNSEPKKPWSGKPGSGDFAQKGLGGRKKWGPGGPGGGNKWGGKPRKFGGGFGGRSGR